tara:strand:+ start:34 stop:654 length:621 start_codon:yes stop_codon:yes gene_type:complete
MQQKAQGLKKEFKRKDVDRLRNLVQGKVGSSSETQVGYKKKQIDYKEGDVWKENRKTWTIKNGIKQTISKLDIIKKEVFMPLSCPECSKIMKHRLDKPNFKIHKKCMNCVIDFEGKLKHVPGRYEKYLKELELKNNLTRLDNIEAMLLETANISNDGYVSENGVIERWVGGIDKNQFSKDIKKYSAKTRKKLENELNDSERTKGEN